MQGCFTVVFDFRESLQNLYRLAARRAENSPPDCFLIALSNPTSNKKAITADAVMAFLGGPGGIRTHDLSDANRTLSQLSYGPLFNCDYIPFIWCCQQKNTVCRKLAAHGFLLYPCDFISCL